MYTGKLETDADYRKMFASTLREILIDVLTNDIEHIEAIAKMAVIVNNDGQNSDRAISHLLQCGYFPSSKDEVH